MTTTHKPKIGLALGGGSARGWAHIGVIRALTEAGIVPDMVCGTSIGALVGAAYVNGDLDRLEQWTESLTLQTVVGFLDFSLGGGLIKGEKLIEFFRSRFVDMPISELPLPFAAVATDLQTGREVWLQEGMVSDAVRSSIALPGLLTPVEREGRWLVDGGLWPRFRSPAPDNGGRPGDRRGFEFRYRRQHLRKARASKAPTPDHSVGAGETVLARIQSGMATLGIAGSKAANNRPSMLEVLASSINIMQARITRSRLAGDPADVLISPRLAEFGLMEFHRASNAIEAGSRATKPVLQQIHLLLENG